MVFKSARLKTASDAPTRYRKKLLDSRMELLAFLIDCAQTRHNCSLQGQNDSARLLSLERFCHLVGNMTTDDKIVTSVACFPDGVFSHRTKSFLVRDADAGARSSSLKTEPSLITGPRCIKCKFCFALFPYR